MVVCYDYAGGVKKPIPELRRVALDRDAIDPAEEGWPPTELQWKRGVGVGAAGR